MVEKVVRFVATVMLSCVNVYMPYMSVVLKTGTDNF